jgi:hypothetical protein
MLNSVPGPRGHITKMHKTKKRNAESDLDVSKETSGEHENMISSGADKIVSQILDDIICLTDEDETDTDTEEVTLEEKVDKEEEIIKIKYTKKCENCAYEAKQKQKISCPSVN